MEWFTGHYGVDWVATGFMLASVYALGNRRRGGFLLGMVASVAWAVFGVMVGSAANIVANAVLFALNLRGWLRWSERAERPEERR